MLELKSISKTFNPGTINEKKALRELSLHLKPGDFVTVIRLYHNRRYRHNRSARAQEGCLYRQGLSGSHDGHGAEHAA